MQVRVIYRSNFTALFRPLFCTSLNNLYNQIIQDGNLQYLILRKVCVILEVYSPLNNAQNMKLKKSPQKVCKMSVKPYKLFPICHE